MGGFEPAPTGKSVCSTFGICRSPNCDVLFAFWFYLHLHNQAEKCLATSSAPKEGRTRASLTVGRVSSRVAVLTRADHAQASCP